MLKYIFSKMLLLTEEILIANNELSAAFIFTRKLFTEILATTQEVKMFFSQPRFLVSAFLEVV